ncbi:MAG: CRISPR-associated endonuclease Cas1 [Saprospiraceae bacterium]|nr:CRISPR-associated endonuclease Cas1 [Saprospiraceae bacterium]
MEITVNTEGAYLHVREGMFEVRIKEKDNATVRTQQIAVHKVRTIALSERTMLSASAVKLALQHNVDIVFLAHDGFPIGRLWHSKLGSTTKIRKRQLEASLTTEGVVFTKNWIIRKVENQLDFIKDLKKHRAQHADFLNDKISKLEALIISIQTLEGRKVSDIADILRGLEGTAGRLFFETVSYVFPKDYQFSGRSMRPAHDAFNAMLNYGYGILYRRVEKALIMAGLDPFVGFFHRDDYNQKSMVYDFIEPYRVWIDESVFRLFSGKKVNKAHLLDLSLARKVPNTEGVKMGIGLTKEGKELVATQVINFLDDEGVRYKNKNQTRGNILQLEAHGFAQMLLDKKEEDFDIQSL